MKRQVIMLTLLCVFSIMARGQNSNTSSDVQCDTLKKTEQRQKCHRTPVNDYSGLNSLRARIANRFWDGRSDTTKFQDAVDERIVHADGHNEPSVTVSSEAQKRRGEESMGNLYFDEIISSGLPIGVPVMVFFKGGGTVLTDSSQILNVKAVAELAAEYGFRVGVTGTADSATGSQDVNMRLSQARADYISSVIQEYGVSADMIEVSSEGGINSYTPTAANRSCRVYLML